MAQARWTAGSGSAAEIRASVAAWISAAALRRLLAAFASSSADRDLIAALGRETGTIIDRLAGLERFSERWDTRGGGERHEAGTLPLTENQEEVLRITLAAIGLRDEDSPLFHRYDHVLILGGMVGPCLLRANHAAGLMSSHSVQAGSVVALATCRPLTEDERRLAAMVGLEHQTSEYTALDSIVRRAFFLDPASCCVQRTPGEAGLATEIGTYRRPDGLQVMVVSAPSSAPGTRRANTADTYSFVAERLLSPGAGHRTRLLIVSSPLHRLAQHVDAVRVLSLPHDMRVDTIGCREHVRPGSALGPNTASECLMELRSTIRAVRRLAASL